jgi:SAM-dependent methyltransferase/uncharacterized protein YbaR (Trm112 family)
MTPLGVPDWLVEVVRCPDDGATLAEQDEGYRCLDCRRTFPVEEGIIELLPRRLAHLGDARERQGGPSGDDSTAGWVSEEMAWWNPYYARFSAPPFQPRKGLRGSSRERNLFRHVRDRVGPSPTVVEMGAGPSRTVAGLWPPASSGLRYVATDLSRPGLRAGEAHREPGTAAVQCDAGAWPFAEGSADVVVILGVLHHIPDWEEALGAACNSVRPGGFLLLHEVVWKPRILARFRSRGVTDAWTSPHEGAVSSEALRTSLEARGTILRWRGESSPLRFALVHYGRLNNPLERSRALTVCLDLLDQGFGRILGAVHDSLGFAEVTCLWRRASRRDVAG